MLIIEVNLRPGVKKEVFVFEGDTADVLADNFAKENDLDDLVKEKLKNLIQMKMSQVLTKIDEEENVIKNISIN